MDNHKKIEEHNDKELGWKMGHNEFSDLTENEFLEIYA